MHSDIPDFGPPLPFPPIFKVGPELQEYLVQTGAVHYLIYHS